MTEDEADAEAQRLADATRQRGEEYLLAGHALLDRLPRSSLLRTQRVIVAMAHVLIDEGVRLIDEAIDEART